LICACLPAGRGLPVIFLAESKRSEPKIFLADTFLAALGATIIGLIILYLPDKDLKEIEKL